jgi:hypothetical protein
VSGAVEDAAAILDAAERAGLALRAWGGCGAALACPSLARPPLHRDPHDVDLIAGREDSAAVDELLCSLGFAPEVEGNRVYGAEGFGHRCFYKPRRRGGPAIDVQFDVVGWYFFFRPEPSERTISDTDLLVTKLAPTRTQAKLVDATALLLDHEPDEQRLSGLLSPWPGWRQCVRAFVAEAESLAASVLTEEEARRVALRADRVRQIATADSSGELDEEAVFAEATAIAREQLQRTSRAA